MMQPDQGYISFIINPGSGKSSSKATVRAFVDYLKEHQYDIRVTLTTSLEHARQLAEDAAGQSDCYMVIVSGGDGTIREVVQGVQGSDKLIMFVPSGTENLLASEMGYDEKLSTLIKAFDGEIRSLDLGQANGQCFTSIAGFGFDGDVVKRVHRNRDGNITHFDYFWPLWRTFWDHKFPVIGVSVDGEEIFHGPGLVFVGNISRYAIGLQILKKADYGDGLLDVCIYKCGSRLHLAKHAIMTLCKRHTKSSDVIYKQGKVINVTGSPSQVGIQIDGDPGPSLPVEIKVIPQTVKILVPPGAKPAGIRTRMIRAIS